MKNTRLLVTIGLFGLVLVVGAYRLFQYLSRSNDDRWHEAHAKAVELYEQGKYEECAELSARALKFAEKRYGPESANTGASLMVLAGCEAKLGRPRDARPRYEKALAIFERTFGPEHVNVAKCLTGLAALLEGDEAVSMYQRALAIWKKQSGRISPDEATCTRALAELFSKAGRLEEAEGLYRQALSMTEQLYGTVHPEVARVLEGQAEMYRKLGREEDARRAADRAKDIRSKNP